MRLTLHTDYALRVLIEAGLKADGLVTINEIADRHGISKNHLTKVVHQLGRSGLLETVRGKAGGVRLALPPDQISLGRLVRQIEDDCALARCMRPARDAEICIMDSTCLARHALGHGLEAFFATLDQYDLAQMIAAERKSRPLG